MGVMVQFVWMTFGITSQYQLYAHSWSSLHMVSCQIVRLLLRKLVMDFSNFLANGLPVKLSFTIHCELT